MNDKVQEIILYEVRRNNKEIKELRTDVTTLKVKFGFIAVIFGFIGSFTKPLFLAFFK